MPATKPKSAAKKPAAKKPAAKKPEPKKPVGPSKAEAREAARDAALLAVCDAVAAMATHSDLYAHRAAVLRATAELREAQ